MHRRKRTGARERFSGSAAVTHGHWPPLHATMSHAAANPLSHFKPCMQLIQIREASGSLELLLRQPQKAFCLWFKQSRRSRLFFPARACSGFLWVPQHS